MKSLVVLVFLWSSAQGVITVKNIAMEMARIGGNVTLQCQLTTSEPNVIQITWQKESGNFTGTVATISKVYGQKLLGYYSKRARHSANNTLNVSAITISPVTPEDEGCFKCIFNLFPLGASTGIICLEVYEAYLQEPYLEVLEITQPKILDKLYTVTCSATGKPAPSIRWIHPENLDITPETNTIINLNKTETVISNFTLPIASILDVPVTCVVQHPSLSSEKHLSTVIDGNRSQDSDGTIFPIITFTMSFLCSVFGLVGIWACLGKWKKNKKLDINGSETAQLNV